jgi:hypothetical protein
MTEQTIRDLDVAVVGDEVHAQWECRRTGLRHRVGYGHEAGHLVQRWAASDRFGDGQWREVWREAWPLLQRVGWETPRRVDAACRVMAQRELRLPEVIEREGPRAS